MKFAWRSRCDYSLRNRKAKKRDLNYNIIYIRNQNIRYLNYMQAQQAKSPIQY